MGCNTGCWIAAPLVTRRCAMLTYLFMVPTNSVMQWRVGWCGDGEITASSLVSLPPPTLSWQPPASPARGRWRQPQSSVLGDGSLEELRHNTNNFLAPGGTTQQQYNGNTLRTGRTEVIYAISTQYLRRHQRSRYIYETTRSQWWTSRNERRATVPSSSTAWRASRSRRRTTRTTTSDTTSVSGLYHHFITALWLTLLWTHPREYIERLIPDSTLQFLTEYWIENRCDVKAWI